MLLLTMECILVKKSTTPKVVCCATLLLLVPGSHFGIGVKYWKPSFSFTYLGVPLFKGKYKTIYFTDLIKEVKKCLLNWSSHFVSVGGKLILSKHVLQSMHVP